jgi:single-stranded-DNA-specific exonuclease
MKKIWRKKIINQNLAKEIAVSLNIPDFLAEILVGRSIDTPSKVEKFLNPKIEHAENPYIFPEMKKASQRLAEAIMKGEIIGIFSDADADGITAAAIISNFVKDCGAEKNLIVRVPSRDKEGYGLTKDFIEEVRKKGGHLIITADCGIRNHEEIKYAKILGIDVIVCDHHHTDYYLPQNAYAILHPTTIPEESSAKFLSGAGVSFELIAATRNELKKAGKELPRPRNYLDIVSIGTIGDMVPLIGDNRIFVKHGIENIRNGNGRLGLNTLIQKINIKKEKITSQDIQMRIVPRINSSGRAGRPEVSFRLLVEEDIRETERISNEIEIMNSWRKEAVQSILEEIEFYGFIDDSRFSCVAWGKDWHEGVLGLVAAKILEKTGKPTCVISVREDIARGSLRSPEFLNIMGVLDKLSHLLVKYGGHSQAAGIALLPEKVQEFAESFESEVKKSLKNSIPQIIFEFDQYLNLEDIRAKELSQVLLLEPFGEGNPNPIFFVEGEIVESRFVGKDENILKMLAKTKDGFVEIVSFNHKTELFLGRTKFIAKIRSSHWSDLGFEFELIEIQR